MKDEIKTVVPTSWKPDYDEFLEALGVSHSGLGDFFFEDVYKAIFVTSIEVKNEFRKFYSVEYSNLEEYLMIRYGINISEKDLEATQIFLVSSTTQVIDDTYEENMLDTVIECIKKLEKAHDEN